MFDDILVIYVKIQGDQSHYFIYLRKFLIK